MLTQALLFAPKRQVMSAIAISDTTLKVWRLGTETQSPKLIEGVHWVRNGRKQILYNVPLLQDFIANLGSPEAHERAIESYLESLPSYQPKKAKKAS